MIILFHFSWVLKITSACVLHDWNTSDTNHNCSRTITAPRWDRVGDCLDLYRTAIWTDLAYLLFIQVVNHSFHVWCTHDTPSTAVLSLSLAPTYCVVNFLSCRIFLSICLGIQFELAFFVLFQIPKTLIDIKVWLVCKLYLYMEIKLFYVNQVNIFYGLLNLFGNIWILIAQRRPENGRGLEKVETVSLRALVWVSKLSR